jgi:hypothetical protein
MFPLRACRTYKTKSVVWLEIFLTYSAPLTMGIETNSAEGGASTKASTSAWFSALQRNGVRMLRRLIRRRGLGRILSFGFIVSLNGLVAKSRKVPEWPVLRSCNKSKASPPRISPSMIWFGRCRRAGFRRSRIDT